MAEVVSAGLGALGSGTIMSVETRWCRPDIFSADMDNLCLMRDDYGQRRLGQRDRYGHRGPWTPTTRRHRRCAEAADRRRSVDLSNGGLTAELSYSMADVASGNLTLELRPAV